MHARRRLGLPAGLALLALAASAGCATHVGRPCNIGATAAGAPPAPGGNVNTGALECPSRICVLPAQQRTSNTGPLCTAACNSDDDCSMGERRDRQAPDDHRCLNGFACRRLFPPSAGADVACKKICVCKDFLPGDASGSGDAPGCGGSGGG